MSTQIKRLYQNSTEFVPITLSEAVVVNTNGTNLSQLGITTLDKVLYNVLGLIGTNSQNITLLNQVIETINTALSDKQDKITWGEGFEIDENGKVNVTVTNSLQLYKIVTALPVASKECENQIYLYPSTTGIAGNIWKEFICAYIEDQDIYVWEEIGSVQTDVDLSGYVTKQEYTTTINNINTQITNINTELDKKLTAQNVTTSSGDSF